MEEILVSVWCSTYNHELYISDAIEGFLSQKTDFQYEIIIHDDASTDGTAEIVKKYEKMYPDLIFGLYQSENQYSKNQPSIKWIQELRNKKCRGKYIALCEGDDYWIDVNKLQIQTKWLENHPEYGMIAHNVICWQESNGTIKAMNPYNEDKEITAEEIIMQYHGNLPTASLMLRKDLIMMDDLFLETGIGDWIMQLYCITKKNIYYFNRIMSVYRYMHVGSWSMIMKENSEKYFGHCLKVIDFLKKYDGYTSHRYNKYIVSRIQEYVSLIFSTNTGKGKEIFFKQCDIQNVKHYFKYHNYIERLKDIYLQIFDPSYYNKSLELFVGKYEHIVLFGAGDFASRIAEKLKFRNVYFEGFAVSNLKCGEREYMGKPVWSMNAVPFDKKNVGIIISIKPIIWNQLIDVLEKNKFTNYICPFLLEVN